MGRAGKVLVSLTAWTVLAGGSVFVAFVLFEWMMQMARQGTVAMRVTPAPYGVFDEDLGVRYEPGTSISYAYLDSKGRVLECMPEISRTNPDGFRGLDTQRDYQEAEQRVLVSGDSFSHWNIAGYTLVDYTKAELEEQGHAASLLNVAGGTFGLEHMVVHLAAAIEEVDAPTPDLVAIQFIRDDITRGWWHLDTIEDDRGRPRARLGRSVECLAPDSNCGSDEYLIEQRATQEWCESQKGSGTVDAVGADLAETYRNIRGFFVYVPRAFARLGIIDRQSTSVIPRVVSIEKIDTDRILRAIESIKASGARIVFVYLPTSEEILSRQIYTFDEHENAVLRFYEKHLGVPVAFPSDYSAFDGVSELAVSPFDSHPSAELQRAYGRYLADRFSTELR
ncbi:MAG: hypothetical protein QNJ14_17295 [Woeseiaceae bacterium]|nr:hypothetical protein [Woeseiaceae bacterium]